MKSSFVFFAATVCFVLGLGFYHYLLNHRVIFNGGLSRPLYVFDGTAASTPTGLLKKIISNFKYSCFVLLSKNNSRAFTILLVCTFIPGYSRSPHDWIPMREALRGPFAQNDSRLLSYINANHIIRPPSIMPYNLSNPDTDPSMGQSRYILFK